MSILRLIMLISLTISRIDEKHTGPPDLFGNHHEFTLTNRNEPSLRALEHKNLINAGEKPSLRALEHKNLINAGEK